MYVFQFSNKTYEYSYVGTESIHYIHDYEMYKLCTKYHAFITKCTIIGYAALLP